MSKKIGINEFFDDGFAEGLKALSEAWKQHSAILVETLDEIKNVAKAMKKQSSASKNTTKAMDAEAKMARRLKNSKDELTMSLHKSNQEYRENLYQAKQNNAQKSAEAKINKTVEGSYNRLSAELTLNKIKIKELGHALGANGANFEKLAKKIKETEDKLAKMDKMMGVSKRNVGNYSSALKGAKIQTANYGKTVQKVTGLVKRFAAVYLGFEAFRSAVRTTRDLTVQTDSLRLAYSKIIPDSQKLAKTNQFLRQTAENYGVDLNSLRKNYLRFTAASKSSNLTMEQTQSIFNSVAKAGSVMGLEAIRMDRAFNALEQMLSKGKVSSEELRQQLGDSLPGSMEIMADALDVTTLELSKMLEEGKVLSDEALPKFAKQLEITYGIQNLNRVENLAASQGRLKTAIIDLVDAMETTGTFRDFYTAMADGVKFIARNVDAIKNLIKAITALGIAYAGLNFGAFISSIRLTRIGMLRLIVTIKQAVVATKAWNLALRSNALGALITAITTAIGLFVLFNKRTTESKEIMGKLTEMQSELNEEIQEAIEKNNELEESKRKSVQAIKDEVTQKKVLNWEEEYGLELKREQIRLETLYMQLKAGGDKFDKQIIFRQISEGQKRIKFLKEQLNFAKLLTPAINKAISATTRLFMPGAKPFITVTPKVTGDGGGGGDKEEDEFGERERSVNAMREGLLKELALLKLKHDKEDAELEKHGEDVTKNDAKHFDERLALLYSYYSDKKKAEEDDKKRLAAGQKWLQDMWIKEFKIKQQIEIEKRRLEGDTKFDEEFWARKRKIDLLEEELRIRTDLTDSERELMDLQKQNLENWYKTRDAFLDFLKTTQGGSMLQAVLGPMGGAMLQGQLQGKKPKGEKVKGADEIKAPEVFGKGVDELFGLENQAQVDALVEGFKIAKDAMTDYYQTAIQLANQLIQTRRQEVQSAERNLQNEIANRNAGRANFIDDAQARLDAAKAAEEQALKNRQKLQQEKLVMDTVTQASNLITGVSEIWKAYGSQPWLAGALTAGMFGAFAVSKVKAFEATRQEFAEGDLSIIGGGRHGSGKDTLVGYEGNKVQFAERGEARMILSRRATARYAEILPSLFEQLSNGTFDADRMIGRNAHISQSPVIFNADMSDTNSELSRIRKQGEEREYAHSDRTIIKRGRFKQILRH